MGRSGIWKYLGVIGLWCCLFISAYYLYIESWCMAYALKSVIGGFAGMTPDDVTAYFGKLTGTREHEIFAISPWGMGFFFVCIAINIAILSRGLAKGIEVVAKIGMPLLILFAIALAVRGLWIDPRTDAHAVTSPFEGLNFVWQPKFSSLTNPSVWLAAAGQIFFTLSIGMGSIHCYSSYLREKDDVALTGATTAWTNEFCEVILGGTILIPIAVAYLGLDQVKAQTASGSGLGLGFFVFPTLFNNWGPAFARVAGFLWFGLLFFAAITSSLAMGQPILSFLEDEFGFSRNKAALSLGGMVLTLAVPVAILNSRSAFDEFDYWAGTFALVVFATVELVLFAWVFGLDNGWRELMKGAELKVPRAFYYILKFITPVFLMLILLAYIFQPAGKVDGKEQGWQPYLRAPFTGEALPAWDWSKDGMIGKLLHRDITDGKTPEEQAFHVNLRRARTFDRCLMFGTFLFLAFLVNRAWARRRAEGRN